MIMSDAFNAALFSEDAISEETAAFLARLTQAEREGPAREDVPLAIERAASPGGGLLPIAVASARAENRIIAGPAGDLLLRAVRPKDAAKGIYIHYHGGGFSLGSASRQDAMLESMADAASVVAISVEYRLAPEHPYPAAAADGEAAAWWAVRNGMTEYGTDRVVLGGESAGAHISIVSALRLRDRRGYTGLAGLNLSQGGYDLTLTPSMRAGARTNILSLPVIKIHLQRLLGDRPRDTPDVSPLYADLRDLPPALFTVGTRDPLLDDSMFMYCRWIASGNAGELAIYPGGVHGFTYLPLTIGREAQARVERFVGGCCAGKAAANG